MEIATTKNFITAACAREKLSCVHKSIELAQKGLLEIPATPGRDLVVLQGRQHPPKKGLSFVEGKARMLHDLANIELQATELFLRELSEYPDAPEGFREELSRLIVDESIHFQICLDRIEELGFKWGDFPVHLGLWAAVSQDDSLLDRILIVHRYLEASGLDAGAKLVKRLQGLDDRRTEMVVRKINDEELSHVLFGSNWYRRICENLGLNSEVDFAERFKSLEPRLPLRMDPLNVEARLKAGFTNFEIAEITAYREARLLKQESQ